MAIINLSINNSMRDEFLNDWKNGEIYLVVTSSDNVIGSKEIAFGNATSTTGGRKIEWTPSGTTGDNGSDFVIPVGTTITRISIVNDDTAVDTSVDRRHTYTNVNIDEAFTYGGIIRIDKITITLT